MDLIEILREDYRRFPADQHYECYAEDVLFKDPLTQFRGRERYRQMIQFIGFWFKQPRIELHDIQQTGAQIRTEWTLSWLAPLPWRPAIAVRGWSELQLDVQGLICSHIDYWSCSRLNVLQQHLRIHK
ncbi:DUF2358 domain-containing protein [Leptolyngbya sp. FACHB-261]|uniref:DUF2358 domain-containing protein n=1 Tax=Leptolyngbya sp. FACHB-261 TaxID=2692806 RepID=UPI001689DE3C|nr:DUF2358 domain-containing protein [Leptolyngbya sp. FACHB-261]MBD2101819.1 DUF2358 domain-containing protein [Leptolyngbya sp. FACHB-261]